jgi:TetR/AcrR family transcriptional repressor of lmrAB and yxaGH operons
MKKGERTKQRMIEATAALLQSRGFHGTGLNQIVQEAGAPKGSLYFHFPGGKEELAAAAVQAAGQEWQTSVLAVLQSAPDLGTGARAVCQLLADSLEATAFDNGCPVATVALESAAHSDVLQQACAGVFHSWQDIIEEQLHGIGLPAERAARTATAVLAMVEGALLLAKTYRDTEPLQRVGDELADLFALISAGR